MKHAGRLLAERPPSAKAAMRLKRALSRLTVKWHVVLRVPMNAIFSASTTSGTNSASTSVSLSAAKRSSAKPKEVAARTHIRTVLIPNCGWPTEAMAITRKSSPRR
jgi:hypothetical protein